MWNGTCDASRVDRWKEPSGEDGRVHLTISSHCGANSLQIGAQTVSDMNLPVYTVDEQCLQAEGLADLPIARLANAKPLILIGQDNVELLVTQKARIGRSRTMVASETAFGWMVEGQDRATPEVERCMLMIQGEAEGERLEKIVEQYIEAENFGMIAWSWKVQRTCMRAS